MRKKHHRLAEELETGLKAFSKNKHPLPGIQLSTHLRTLVEQLLDSIHRVEYFSVIRERDIDERRTDPSSDLFDPIRAAILHQRQGRMDEAFWLIFLAVYFGKHRKAKWQLAQDVYGALGHEPNWDWERTSADPTGFRQWISANEGGLNRYFGNHRKFESLKASSGRGTGMAVVSYVRWVDPPRNHEMIIQEAQQM
ncbi:MAG: hypothetical protein V3W19_05340, partial [Desulfatiglandales bacterium]